MPIFIIKDKAVEKYVRDWATGTMINSGLSDLKARETVLTTEKLFEELKVSHVPVEVWPRITEEVRRGNIATATLIIKGLPKITKPLLKEISEPSIDSNTIPNDDVLIKMTKEIVSRPARFDAYSHIQSNEDFYTSTLMEGDPVLGYITARFQELMDYAILNAGKEMAPTIFASTKLVLEELNVEVSSQAFSRWKKRYYVMTNGPFSKHIFYTKKKELSDFIKRSVEQGRLFKNSIWKALSFYNLIMNKGFPAFDNPIVEPDPLKHYRLTDEEKSKTRTRPVIKHPTANPKGFASRPKTPDDGSDPRDTPPPTVFGEELDNLAYIRWTTEEFPPFIRPDKHVLYCWKPIDDNGDRTKVIEFSGGYSLTRARPKAKQLQFITKNWDKRVEEYWPPFPLKSTLVPVGEATWVDSFIIKTSDTDDINPIWKDIEKKIREELNKDSTKDKLKEKINDALDDILGDVTVFGIGLGGAASGVAKLAASAIIEFINWFLDEVFSEESFQTVVVTHKTNGGAGMKSWLTWGTVNKDNGKAENFDPRMDDLHDNLLNTIKISSLKGTQTGQQTKGLSMPGIYWEGESQIPDRLPADINHIFKLANAHNGEIYWPSHFKYGGHVFIPVKARESDALYCIAIRTEVRAIWLQNW